MKRTAMKAIPCLLLAAITPAQAQQTPSAADEKTLQDVQRQFAEAYNRQDADAMAALFAENAVRITPGGIFQGRDAIRRDMQNTLQMGLRDYAVRRTISRSLGNLVFNAGEWQAKLGDRQYHGYYSALLILDDGQPRIIEETVTVAPPTSP